MMAKPIQIGDRQFKTRMAATKAIRDLVARHRDGDVLVGEDFILIRSLLNHHPRAFSKIGDGVAAITVETNHHAIGGKTRGFWLTRTDGSRTDFSWVSCMSPPSSRKDVLAAMRAAVADQIEAFRRQQYSLPSPPECPLTGESLLNSSAPSHVDHVPPDTFDVLARRFLAEWGASFDDVAINHSEDGSLDTLLTDEEFSRAWQEYHREHAKLRLLSRTGNLSHAKRMAT